MGDFKIECIVTSKVTGQSGLGERNERGDRLVQFFIEWWFRIPGFNYLNDNVCTLGDLQMSARRTKWKKRPKLNLGKIDYIFES